MSRQTSVNSKADLELNNINKGSGRKKSSTYHTGFATWEDERLYNVLASISRGCSRLERHWKANCFALKAINNLSPGLFADPFAEVSLSSEIHTVGKFVGDAVV